MTNTGACECLLVTSGANADLAARSRYVRERVAPNVVGLSRMPSGLRAVFAPQAITDVNALVEMERQCCAFLDFQLDGEVLTITGPDGAGAILEAFYDALSGEPGP